MKIENIFSYLVILALLFVSSLFTACNVNGPGIFYTIYNEKKISESLVSDKPVYKVVSAGSSLYVRAGAAVYKNDGTAWNKIDPPSAGMRAVSLGRIGSAIYAVYESEASGALSDTIYTLSGTSWSKLSDTVPAVSAIDGSLNLSLITVDHDNNIFFINQRTGSGTYSFYSFDGSFHTLTSEDVSQPVISAAVSGVNYFLAASNISGSSVLYTTNGSSTVTTVITTGFDTAKTIGGISEDALNGNLYLSTRDGYLYKSSDAAGVDWGTGSLNSTALTDSYGTACLGDMAVVDYNGTDYLIIAADNGYFEMDLTGTSPELPTVTAENFETYELSQEAVFSLYTETDKIYIGSDNGLWLSEYSGGPALDKE
ncbi:MAG: hypothetical protein DRP59_00015 [Spirochaetes bacterium]|nr:MAG: hypothetical protein DRP59_00015 [Spirochaetota bacterium]